MDIYGINKKTRLEDMFMSKIYLETNAVRKLTDFKCDNKVFTSVFVLFELISGINNSEQFRIRKANIEKIFSQEIYIVNKMVDQVLCELVREDKNKYDPEKGNIIYSNARKILKMKSYEDFVKEKIVFYHCDPILYKNEISIQSWLKQWDDRISNIRLSLPKVFNEDKNFIKKIYQNDGMKGLAQYYWGRLEENKLDERRIGHASAFCSKDEIEYVREENERMFSTYNFRLFMTAQAIIFAKAIYIDGGTQDKNNPSDLLHLLYLEEGDQLVSNDKIYSIIAEGIEDFHYIKIGKEKNLSDLL